MTFDQALADLKQRPITEFYQLEKSRGANMYCCPICDSGHGVHKTGALSVDPNTNRVTCFSEKNTTEKCFGDKGEDTPGALKRIWEHEEGKTISFREVLNRVGYHIGNDRSAPPPKKEKRDPTPAAALEDHTDEYRVLNDFLLQDEAALDTLHSWGITDEAIKHFLIGYNPHWTHHKNPKKESQRFIFPRDEYTYSARMSDRNYTGSAKYMLEGRQGTLFNTSALRDTESKFPIVVVEGEIDAIVIWQLGEIRAVALGSASNKNRFIEQVKKINPAAVYILALDNDEAGHNAQQYIADEFSKAGIAYLSADTASLYDGMKDAGEAVPKDDEEFMRRLYPYLEKGYEMREDGEKALRESIDSHRVSNLLPLFRQYVLDEKNNRPIPTGFAGFDKAIGGGLLPKFYIIGALTTLGKTTFVLQIADNVAKAGTDVLIFSLEMAKEDIIARSISRHTYQRMSEPGGNTELAKTELGIVMGTRYQNYSQEEKDLISLAYQDYAEYASDHISIYEGRHTAAQIRAITEQYISFTGNTPLVIVDYLQIIQPPDDLKRATGKEQTDANIDVFAEMRRELKTPIIGISSFNRNSYTTVADGSSFKESGNIEYSGDCIITLELDIEQVEKGSEGTRQNTMRDRIKEAMRKNPREIKLTFQKNRGNKVGTTLFYRYNAMFNFYEEDWTKDAQL